MNYYTNIISNLLKISIEMAYEVQKQLEMTGFDFSEASDAQFKREGKIILRTMK